MEIINLNKDSFVDLLLCPLGEQPVLTLGTLTKDKLRKLIDETLLK